MGGGFQQRARIGMLQIAEERLGRTAFDHLALTHDHQIVGKVGHDRQVVADQHQPHAVLGNETLQKFQDLCLGRDIQCSGRFVGNQKLGLESNGHGDDHSLALTAGEFVRIPA